MKKVIFTLALIVGEIFLPLRAFSQNSLDSVLVNINNNNKSIVAYNQFLKAEKVRFNTGLSLNDPTIEYDYLKGTPADAGNQIDFTAIQSFDFPTVYGKRKEVSRASIDRLGILEKEFRQQVLLEAKLIYLKLIYLNNFESQLNKRNANAERLLVALKVKFDKGGVSYLDINKAKINLSLIQNELRAVLDDINESTQQLIELNGGFELEVTDTIYPIVEKLAPMEAIFNKAKIGNFAIQNIQKGQQISEKKEELNKALALPKIEAGFRYQSILGQTFNGFHVGLSIPLFENKNKVQAAKQETIYFGLLEESHINKLRNELEALYNKAKSLKQGMTNYNHLFNEMNSEELLNKAFKLGEISNIEYFMELQYAYLALENYLKQQRDYHLVISELKKYEL